ncbi:MAG: hypothetical protein ACTHKF_07430, partial [Candidatus Nitrosocosmicus sp.]
MQNLIISVLFIVMFFKRRSSRGQSIYIAVFKMLGTGLVRLYFYLYEPIAQSSFILSSFFISILFFYVAYIYIMTRENKQNKVELITI